MAAILLVIDFHFPMAIVAGGSRILLHGLLEAVGIFIAFRYYLWLRKRSLDPVSGEHRIWIVIAAAMGAVIGSRVVGAAENIPGWMSSVNRVAWFWGNKTLVGGLLGGLFGVEMVKKLIGEKQSSGDLFVYPLLLGMLVGRLGCFSAGVYEETYGFPTGLPWAMDLGDGIPRHPVVLYEIAFLLALTGLLIDLRKKYTLRSGALFKIFMISYLLFRFALDFIKPGWHPVAGLGTIQLTCLAGLCYYIRYLVKPRMLLSGAALHQK